MPVIDQVPDELGRGVVIFLVTRAGYAGRVDDQFLWRNTIGGLRNRDYLRLIRHKPRLPSSCDL